MGGSPQGLDRVVKPFEVGWNEPRTFKRQQNSANNMWSPQAGQFCQPVQPFMGLTMGMTPTQMAAPMMQQSMPPSGQQMMSPMQPQQQMAFGMTQQPMGFGMPFGRYQ